MSKQTITRRGEQRLTETELDRCVLTLEACQRSKGFAPDGRYVQVASKAPPDEGGSPLLLPRAVWNGIQELLRLHSGGDAATGFVAAPSAKDFAKAIRQGLSHVGRCDQAPYSTFAEDPIAVEMAKRVAALGDQAYRIGRGLTIRTASPPA